MYEPRQCNNYLHVKCSLNQGTTAYILVLNLDKSKAHSQLVAQIALYKDKVGMFSAASKLAKPGVRSCVLLFP